jgi:hypothetical protein
MDDVLVQFPRLFVGQNVFRQGGHFAGLPVRQSRVSDLVHEFLNGYELRGIP